MKGPIFHLITDVTFFYRTCRDKSDRVFEVDQSCPPDDEAECMDWFGQVFPCPESPAQICRESCGTAEPGSPCQACANSTYFHCSLSNQCVHPDLKCDGHPQCEHGEDEDLGECILKYQENKLISKYATYRCRNIMYPIIETYATACDNFPECVNGEDEEICTDNTALYVILPSALGFIALLHIILKFGRLIYWHFKKGTQKVYSF